MAVVVFYLIQTSLINSHLHKLKEFWVNVMARSVSCSDAIYQLIPLFSFPDGMVLGKL